MISASQVKELREATGAGMMDCKKALVETNGNMEEAITWLREKGIMKAAKKESRIAAEGICKIVTSGNKALVFEVNSETDFVAKNEKFQTLVEKVGNAILNSNAKTDEEALEVETGEGKVKDLIIGLTATIGEKISLRRVNVVTKSDNQVFGMYSHMGGRIVALSILEGGTPEIAKDVCMHVAAMSPKFLDKTKGDKDFLDKESEILKQEAINSGEFNGKPEAIIDKIMMGKVNKMLKGICLVDQEFVKNPDLTVGQYVANNHASIVSYIRLEVGEGIEKRKDDFVAEVMAAVNN